MTETLLVLNGHPVILTSDEAESLVQNGAAAISGISSHENSSLQEDGSKNIFVPMTAADCSITQTSDIRFTNPIDRQSLQSNFVQVKVDGKEIPGFVLDGGGDATALQSFTGHQQNSFSLLTSDKQPNAAIVSSETEHSIATSEFLQLNGNASDKVPVLSKSTEYSQEVSGEAYNGEVYTLSAGGELIQSQLEQSTVSDLDFVSAEVPSVEQKAAEGSLHVEKPNDGGHRIVAVIRGEDGSTQSIAIPMESEGYQLNIPQVLAQEVSQDQHQVGGEEKLSEANLTNQIIGDAPEQVLKLDCNSEELQNNLPNNSSIFIGDSGEKVVINIGNGKASPKSNAVLEPVFLLPGYGNDGNISTVQIGNVDSETPVNSLKEGDTGVKEPSIVSSVKPLNFTGMMSEGPRKAKSLLFPNRGQSDVNMMKVQKHNRNHNTSRINTVDWKRVTTKFKNLPKVSGSKYLRDIAKRTKFHNLSSLLDAQHISQDLDITKKDLACDPCTIKNDCIVDPSVCIRDKNQLESILMKAEQPTQSSISNESSFEAIVSEAVSPTVPLNEDIEGRLLNTDHFNHTNDGLSTSMLESAWDSSCNIVPDIQQVEELQGNNAVTIKVNTGSLNGNSSLENVPFTPIPSIECKGGDGPDGNLQPLMSIVYFSSQGDEPPHIVQFPSVDTAKPLGSTENPIQLVQQGNTFQPLQPIHKEQMEQINTLLQQKRFSAPLEAHDDEIYDPKSNMKFVYKVVHPTTVKEESEKSEEPDEDINESITLPKKKKRWRPFVKSKMTKIESTSELEDVKVDVLEPEEKKAKLPVSRTRSGRISRPPQHKLTDYRHLLPAKSRLSSGCEDSYMEYNLMDEEEWKKPEQEFFNLDELTRKKRPVSNTLRMRYSCFTCNKLLVGRIESHYQKFPNHRRDPPPSLEAMNQTYSAIKALSDPPKDGSKVEGVGKPVLSPTPGTQASETNGEPSLPQETSLLSLGDESTLKMELDQLSTSKEHKDEGQGGSSEIQVIKSEQNEAFGPGDSIPKFDPPPQAVPPRRGRGRGRGRRGRGRGGWARTANSAPSKSATVSAPLAVQEVAPPTPLPPPSPSAILEQVLSGYCAKDIMNAVTKHLAGRLTPWQFLCSVADQRSPDTALEQWQERFDSLQNLLKQCKEACGEVLQPVPDQKAVGGSCQDCTQKKKATDLQAKKAREKLDCHDVSILSFEDLLKEDASLAKADMVDVCPVKIEVANHIKVHNEIASAVGMSEGCYTLKTQKESLPTPLSKPQEESLPTSVSSILDSCSRPADADNSLQLSITNPQVTSASLLDSSVNSSKEIMSICQPEDRPSKHSMESDHSEERSIERGNMDDNATEKLLVEKCSYEALSKVSCVEVPSFNESIYSQKADISLDVTSCGMMQSNDTSLQLPSYATSEQSMNPSHLPNPSLTSSSLLTTCDVSAMTTSLSSSSINMLLNNEAVMNGTTPTMSVSTPCVTTAPSSAGTGQSLPLEVPHFTSDNSDSDNALSNCIQMSNVDNTLMNLPSLPQVNPMPQIAIGDLDITAEDLPRLLSEGMGMVVGSGGDATNDTCDAPKLLDTSGDTTDLSEMIFKLQEATAGINQNPDPSTYPVQIMSSSQQPMNGHASQLMASQSLSTQPQAAITSQGYSTLGQTINPHSSSDMSAKSLLMQNCSQSSAPLLTFTGALSTNSEYCNVSPSINQDPINSVVGDMKGHQNIMGPPTNNQCNHLGKAEPSLEIDRDPINIGFPVNSLSNSELEDILKR